MKFTLTMSSDEGKLIKIYNFGTWYDDHGLKKEIGKGGIESLEHIANIFSRSLKSEIDASIKDLLFII